MDRNILICIFFIFVLTCYADNLKISMPPWGGNQEEMRKKITEFSNYLENKTGKNIEIVIGVDYEDVIEMIGNGKTDIAILPSYSYVSAKEKYPKIEYICTTVNKDTNKSSYSSFIISRIDTGIDSYKDLKGKIFVFVDEKSSSGYKYPLALMLSEWKIIPEKYFKKTIFLGNHPNVFKAVYEKQAEAGAIADDVFSEMLKNYDRANIKIIGIIENIPYDAVVFREKFQEEEKKKIKEVFLNVKKEEKILDELNWSGFEEKNDLFYNVIRNTEKTIKNYKK